MLLLRSLTGYKVRVQMLVSVRTDNVICAIAKLGLTGCLMHALDLPSNGRDIYYHGNNSKCQPVVNTVAKLIHVPVL